jgi:hypothetical protein
LMGLVGVELESQSHSCSRTRSEEC